MAVILLLAAGVTIVALLLGLSDKPQLDSIGIAVTPEEATALLADAPAVTESDNSDDELDAAFSVPAPDPVDATTDDDASMATEPAPAQVLTDEFGEPIPQEELTAQDGAAATETAPTAIPIPDPTATPEIVAAVEPTPAPATDDDEDLAALDVPARITAGTVSGSFFTRVFEDEGATVARNEVTLTFNEDGTGSFTGSLDMAMVDETRVTMSMSGPFDWSASASPQVVADLAGSYESDSLIDTDDVSTIDAELTITSLGSGSGALCATDSTCFGFRFPAQTGF